MLNGRLAVQNSGLEPVRLARSGGFGSSELQQIERLVAARADLLLKAWNEYFINPD